MSPASSGAERRQEVHAALQAFANTPQAKASVNLLNSLGYPSAPNIPKQEVTDAIEAVTAFLDLVTKK